MPIVVASSNIWVTWCSTSTTSVTTADIWNGWIETTNATSTATNCYIAQQQQLAQNLSAEQQMRIAQRQRDFQAEMARQRETEERAYKKAKELLMSLLTEEQRHEARERQCFHVRGGRSGTRYRVRLHYQSGNVEVLDASGAVSHRLCAHDRSHGTPWPDQLLAQKLYLEHHEDEFLRIANRH